MAAQNFSAGIAKVQTLVLPLQGQFTASVAAKVKFQPPQNWRLVRVAAVARAKGGTHGTTTVDLTDDAVSVLSAPIDLATPAAGVYSEGAVVANTVIAKESVCVVNLVQSGGSAPTMDDLTVQIDYIPQD